MTGDDKDDTPPTTLGFIYFGCAVLASGVVSIVIGAVNAISN